VYSKTIWTNASQGTFEKLKSILFPACQVRASRFKNTSCGPGPSPNSSGTKDREPSPNTDTMRTVVQHVIALGGLLQQVMYRELASSLSHPAEHYGERLPGPDLNPMASSLALWARQTRTLYQIKCQDICPPHSMSRYRGSIAII